MDKCNPSSVGTYYLLKLQAVTLRSEEVVENQVDERKDEQTEDLDELCQEKEESTEASSKLALILEIQRVQERILFKLLNEQIEDIKIEKLLEFFFLFYSSS
jgi:hypothetical protein